MRNLLRSEKGAMNLVGILLMGIGMVFIAVGFIMLPIVMTGTNALLAYSYSVNTAIVAACFTGFTQVVGIAPLLVLVGYLAAAVLSMYLGVKVFKGSGSTKLDLGTLILLGISMIFIAIGFIIMPVALDGISSVWHGAGQGISATYTGFQPVLILSPLLILLAFVSSAVLSGFFGFKRLTSG